MVSCPWSVVQPWITHPSDHVAAALAALEGSITDRTQSLIAHPIDALAYRSGELGHRACLRLEANEDVDDLMLLRDFDTAGRVCGADVCTVKEALEYIRSLEAESYT